MNRKTPPGYRIAQGRVAKTRKHQVQRGPQHTLTRKYGSRHLDRLYTRECLLAQSREASELSPASEAVHIFGDMELSHLGDCAENCSPKPPLDQSMTVCLVVTPESSNPAHGDASVVETIKPERQIRDPSPVSRTSRTTSPQRKRTSKRYSSRWSSGIQLAPLLESQETLTQAPLQNEAEEQDWETVAGSQQFPFPPRNALMLTHSEAGSSIADYTSYASFSTLERFMNPPAQHRRRRYASLSSTPWHDSSMNFPPTAVSSPPEQCRSNQPRHIHTPNALSDGYPRLTPSPKERIVPVLPTTFTYRHPTPLERSHFNPFKVTPPYLEPGENWQRYDEMESLSDPSIYAQENDFPSGSLIRRPYLAGESIADMSTGMTSTWQSEADLNASTPSTSVFQLPTPCPNGRSYVNRHRRQYHQQLAQYCDGVGAAKTDTPPCNQGAGDSSPIWKGISRAESPISWPMATDGLTFSL
ncbi:hypothetical protein KEM54_001309 [Ascosphaera aggregata]|nr:hypothetical protein KEM54_001309 [Ascosphaera aggregata]